MHTSSRKKCNLYRGNSKNGAFKIYVKERLSSIHSIYCLVMTLFSIQYKKTRVAWEFFLGTTNSLCLFENHFICRITFRSQHTPPPIPLQLKVVGMYQFLIFSGLAVLALYVMFCLSLFRQVRRGNPSHQP